MLVKRGAYLNIGSRGFGAEKRGFIVVQDIVNIHQFWFDALDESGFAAPAKHRLWFSANPLADAELGTRFGTLVSRALAGELDHWTAGDDGLIALVLLLDQFTRNIYRGTPRAFAGDAKALDITRRAIAADRHRTLPTIHRVFLYLPLEHSEALSVQEECVQLFAGLESETGAASVRDFARYAQAHRDVIARFGRFPHRNAILDRPSSAAELAYLEQHGGF